MKNKFIGIILIAIVLLNIIDGDFSHPSFLDIIKILLLVICFILLIKKEKRNEE